LSEKSEKNSPNHKTSSSESEEENANSVSSLSKKECVNAKFSKQNKTFSKKLEQNSSDSEDDNDFISESSKNKKMSSKQSSFKEQKKKSNESESSSEDESSDEPSRFIKKYFKLFSLKPSEKHKKNLSSERSSSEDEQQSISEPSKFTKKSVKPSTKKPKNTSSKTPEHYQSSSNIETSSSEDESISEPSKSTKESAKHSTKEPKKTSSKIPEHYRSSSNIETSSSEDDEQQTISKLSDSNKKSTKNQSCSKSFETPKKAKPSKEISSKTSKEISSKTSSEISSTTSIETSSSSDDEKNLIREPSSSTKSPMTSSYVKKPLSKPSEEAKKDSSKTSKQILSKPSKEAKKDSSKTQKQISLKTSKQISSKTPKQMTSETSKQISSNFESSSSDSEEDSILPPVKPKKIPAKKPTSKPTNKKSTFESTKNDSKKYPEDFSPIMDGYGDLLDPLNPEDPKSEVDKVIKFILEKNIKVRHVNIALSRYTFVKTGTFSNLHKKMPLIKVGRFSPGDFGDDDRLLKRWNELVETVPISNPEQCIVDFSKLKKREVLRKRNVLGCFLGQDLPNVRHCADVFQHACSLLNPLKSGKFSKEEDKIILDEAKRFGPCLSTWKRVILKLNRPRVDVIARRYTLLTVEKSLLRGQWSLTEDEVLLESLFGGRKNAGIEEIKSVALNDFQLCSEQLNRTKQNISSHWRNIVMPILLSHHYATLHRPWRRDFFEYLIEKKVAGVQDIDYLEASSFFPEQSAVSFVKSISCFAKKQSKEKKPLFQIIQENLHSFKDIQETERVRNYREEIVRIYDEAKNRTI
jgi:hypothetical protein